MNHALHLQRVVLDVLARATAPLMASTRTAAFLLLAFAFALLAHALADTPEPATPTRIDVIVIEHTPAGVVERTGYLVDLRYAPPNALIEFVDDGDALFHNGFEGPATPVGPSGLGGQPDCGPWPCP